MRKRIKLADRVLPDYCTGEEIMNMVTHIVGGGLGVIALVMSIIKAWGRGWLDMTAVILYGVSMIALYTMSSVYHGLRPGMGKKVLYLYAHCADRVPTGVSRHRLGTIYCGVDPGGVGYHTDRHRSEEVQRPVYGILHRPGLGGAALRFPDR